MSQAEWAARRCRVLWLLLVVLLLSAPAVGDDGETASVVSSAEAMMIDRGFSLDQVGYVLFGVSDGEVIESHNADRAFIPASVAKIPTTVAALGILGADYRFETTLWAAGAVNDGRLDGPLVLSGGGDPILTSDQLLVFVNALAAHGITEVAGSFLYDDSRLATADAIDPTQPESASYNTGVGALSLNFNTVLVSWQHRDGRLIRASATSTADQLHLPAASISVGSPRGGTDPDIWYDHSFRGDAEHWTLSLRLPPEGQDRLPVRAPGLNAASVFQALGAEHGITLDDPQPGVMPEDAWPVGRVHSRPLSSIVRGMLRYSNNLSAELVGMTASRALTDTALDMPASGAALTGWLADRTSATDWDGARLVNHSGLSSASRLTPLQTAGVLRWAALHSPGGADYFDLLRTVPWEDAVNQERSASRPPVRIRAKSGTMYYARGLAGYIDPETGPRLGFVVFITDFEARAALDASTDPQARQPSNRSRHWLNRARNLERALISHWALTTAAAGTSNP